MGYPAIPLELLEYSEEDIKDLFIGGALEYYFSRFPIKETSSFQAATDFSIDFPSEDVFGITDARVTRRGAGSGGITGNPFRDQLLANNVYNSKSDIGANSFRGVTSQRIKCDVQNRAIKGYVEGSGELLISWAKTSQDFNLVPMKDKQNVIWYAQSIILKKFALLRDQANTGQGVDFNTGPLHTEADKLDRQVMEKWGKRRAVVVIRG